MISSIFLSASAAIVREGLINPVLPGINAPSITYNPLYPLTRPKLSVAFPMTARPKGGAVKSVVTSPTIRGTPGR